MRAARPLLVLILVVFIKVDSLNILAVLPYQGKSHFFVFEPLLLELARRSHNVTVISHFPQMKPVQNYRDISLAGTLEILQDHFPINLPFSVLYLYDVSYENCRILMDNKDVQQLWKSNAKFDVVLVDQFNSDCSLGLAYKLDAPVVGLNSHVLMPWHYERFGIPFNPSYVPFHFLDGGTHPNFFQRMQIAITDLYYKLTYKYMCQKNDQKILEEYLGGSVPPLEDLAREIKILLTYHNFFLTGSRLLPANVREVGGYHVKKPQELPDDIKKFIEESEHGVIYVSFGSLFKSSSLSRDKLDAMIEAFAELPQRTLWKYEEDTLPGNPNNIFISKWFPQNDILAHPKVLAFVSHCGMLGTTEGIHHGVPILGMPIIGDQPSNAAAIEESGLGLKLNIKDITKERFLEKLKILLDPEFRRNVKLLSRGWNDRPLSAMESAIYWIEFAAQYRNFTFRSASADVSLIQYLCLDTISVLFTLFLVLLYSIKFIASIIYKRQNSQSSSKKRIIRNKID